MPAWDCLFHYIKFLLKSESPRDIGDILLSLKHPPNVVISDIPHMVAAHVNKRSPNFFNPFSGRVVEPTDANVKLATEGKLPKVSLPWMSRVGLRCIGDLNLQGTDVHPVSYTHLRAHET